MEFAENVCQPGVGNVGVDFGGSDVRVPEQFLDDAQVGTMFEQVCGEAVPQGVRGDFFRDACQSESVFDV